MKAACPASRCLVFLLFGFTLLVMGEGCAPPHPAAPHRAFYHWQTHFAPTPTERQLLDTLGIDRLYVRFFDVDLDATSRQAIPLAALETSPGWDAPPEVIPTVFITNRTLHGMSPAGADTLGQRIFQKIMDQALAFPGALIREIQIDCDWSGQTREKYFLLLARLREMAAARGLALSCTIRLHQLRYPEQTGVPSVDRGMLMFYNMGDVDDPVETNAILNLAKGSLYLDRARRYPLPLDIALPLFSWGVVFREGHLAHLIHALQEPALSDTLRFRKTGPSRYEVVKSTYLDGYYLYRGDDLRLESVHPDSLARAARLLSEALRREDRTIALYHLDTTTIKSFTYGELEAVFFQMAAH